MLDQYNRYSKSKLFWIFFPVSPPVTPQQSGAFWVSGNSQVPISISMEARTLCALELWLERKPQLCEPQKGLGISSEIFSKEIQHEFSEGGLCPTLFKD